MSILIANQNSNDDSVDTFFAQAAGNNEYYKDTISSVKNNIVMSKKVPREYIKSFDWVEEMF